MKGVQALTLALALANQSQAQTTVCGSINGQTWTSNGSRYLVSCNNNVVSLTIQPGVEVRFHSNYVFKVTGTLKAYGTPSSPVVFTSTNESIGWQGILFANSYNGSEMWSCRVEKAVNSGVRCTNANPFFVSCVFTDNSSPISGGGALIDTTDYMEGLVQFVGCSFSNNVADPMRTSGSAFGGGVFVVGQCSFDRGQFSSNLVNAFNCNGCYAAGGGLYLRGQGSLRNSTFLEHEAKLPVPRLSASVTFKVASLERATLSPNRALSMKAALCFSRRHRALTLETRPQCLMTPASRPRKAACVTTWEQRAGLALAVGWLAKPRPLSRERKARRIASEER